MDQLSSENCRAREKRLTIDLMIIREAIVNGICEVRHIKGSLNYADPFTKRGVDKTYLREALRENKINISKGTGIERRNFYAALGLKEEEHPSLHALKFSASLAIPCIL